MISKREKRRRKAAKVVNQLINMFFWGKRKKLKLYEQFQRDLSKMTNWQNSQWLRAGANRDTTAKFLELVKYDPM